MPKVNQIFVKKMHMQVVRKNQTKAFKNSAACMAFEYPTKGKDINGAVIELAGRYPDAGMVMNEQCSELVYIVSGSGVVAFDGRETEVHQGDVVFIPPKEKYFWDGTMTLFVASTPAWYPGQYKEV